MKSPPPSATKKIKMTTSGTTKANKNNMKKEDNNDTTLGSSAVVFKRQPSNDMINNLKLIADDMASFVGGHDSISSLSLCVNDSAGGEVTFEDTYEIDGILGEGGFATVYRCIHVDNQQSYAVKEIVNTNYEEGNSIKREIMALKRLKEGPYVVRLLDVFKEPTQTHIIMEELNGGDLLARLCEKKYYEVEPARKLSRTLLEAIKFCHNKQIVHRDIKPENILLISPDDDTKIKLADFGCAKRFVPNRPYQLKTLCGTQAYVAPEILMQGDDDDDTNSGYDERCDLWSCGVLIYTMLAGYLPFDDDDDDMLPEYIVQGDYEYHEQYWEHIPESVTTLISGLLTVNPNKRWTVNQALDGEWLQRYSGSNSSSHHKSKSMNGSSSKSSSGSGSGSWNDSERSFSSNTSSIALFDLSLASLAELTERENDDNIHGDGEDDDDDVSSIGGGGSLCLEDLKF